MSFTDSLILSEASERADSGAAVAGERYDGPGFIVGGSLLEFSSFPSHDGSCSEEKAMADPLRVGLRRRLERLSTWAIDPGADAPGMDNFTEASTMVTARISEEPERGAASTFVDAR
jgi:hypothetical protein